MAEARIPVDLFNPGQVFACLGFLEAANVLIGDAQGGFDWSDESDVRFVLRAPGDRNPVEVALAFLAQASVVALAPKGSDVIDQSGTKTHVDADGVFSVSPTVREGTKRTWIKASALPILLREGNEQSISASHWADVDNGRRPLKMWGGDAGKSGASRMNDLLDAVRPCIRANLVAASADPFRIASAIGGFRLDMHRDYVPIDIGFSLNAHKGKIEAMGHPIVEIVAVIGLEHARPAGIDRLSYRYGAWRGMLDPALARPTLGCASMACEVRTFLAQLGEPNKYARSIRNVTEETVK